MKKTVILSLASIVAISGLQAAEDLSSMFSEGKASGQIREFSIIRNYKFSADDDFTRKANAIGGYLKYETAALYGLTLGSAFYTTNGFYLQSSKETNKAVDPTLLGPDNEDYSILGEAYLQYKRGNTTFKGGRQKLNTPLAGADDARMLPNLFEAYMLSNTDIPDTTLVVGQIMRFAQGTFGRAYNADPTSPANQILAATGGYSAVDSRNQVGSFENMGSYAVGTHTDGVSVASATYTGVKGLKVQLWDYYAHDILNAVYGQVDYSMQVGAVKPFVAGQFIKEDNVGDNLLKNMNPGSDGKIDSLFWGVKAGMTIENLTA
ncbi:MAG: OprD family porin, partial [Thiovulaceae bacterium]|nr:OprD family porin [Sulfurimonadaceae bacterium]